jgi:Uma2 family endonuclease
MNGSNIHPPKTMMEAFQSLPEGTLAQLINNQLYMSPSPSNSHQKLVMTISAQLFNYVAANKLGEVRVAPFDVFLNRKNAYQPDIIFIANGNLHNLKERGFFGAPDLVIEILSPATWRFDKEDKKDEYERSGVKEYWMIDPVDKSTEGFYLDGGEYKPLPTEKESITIKTVDISIRF